MSNLSKVLESYLRKNTFLKCSWRNRKISFATGIFHGFYCKLSKQNHWEIPKFLCHLHFWTFLSKVLWTIVNIFQKMFSKHLRSDLSMDTRPKSNVCETFIWLPGSHMIDLCFFSSGCVSSGLRSQIEKILVWKDFNISGKLVENGLIKF